MTGLQSQSNLSDVQMKLHSFPQHKMEQKLLSLSKYQTPQNHCKIRIKPGGLLEVLPVELCVLVRTAIIYLIWLE